MSATSMELVNVKTGELVRLDGPTDLLARYLLDLRELSAQLADGQRLVKDELLERMDKSASYTFRAPGVELAGESPDRWEVDAAALVSELDVLVEDGLIDAHARDQAVEFVPKVKVRGVNALLKLGGRVAEAVERCRSKSERPRRVTVKEKA